MLRTATTLLLYVLWMPMALAQFPGVDADAQREQMRLLEVMHGQWLGQGERYLPNGEKYAFTQTLEIRPESGGLITTIAGQSLNHMRDIDDRLTKQPGSGSFAVLMYDEKNADYLFRSFGFGLLVEARAEFVRPRVFRWTVSGPVILRFTIDLTEDGVWEELGERSRDGGETWEATNRLTAYRVEER